MGLLMVRYGEGFDELVGCDCLQIRVSIHSGTPLTCINSPPHRLAHAAVMAVTFGFQSCMHGVDA